MLLNNKAGKEVWEDRKREGLEFVSGMVREGHTKKVSAKQRLEEEAVSPGESFPDPSH